MSRLRSDRLQDHHNLLKKMWARVMIRYKRFWILGLRNVSKSIDQVQENLNFLQRNVSFKSIDQFARSWQFLKKCDQDWTGDMQQVHGVLKKFEQNFSVWSGVARSSSKQFEQDWCCKQDHRFLTTLRARLILLPMWVEIFFSGVWHLVNFDHTY